MESAERQKSAYSVEKLASWFRCKNPRALERLKFEGAEGRATFDDLRPRLRTVRHTAYLLRIFSRLCIRVQSRVCLGNEFFNSIGQERYFAHADWSADSCHSRCPIAARLPTSEASATIRGE